VVALALLTAGTAAAQNPPAPANRPAAGIATHKPSHRVREAKPGYLKQAKITSDAAEQTALGAVPGGTVTYRMIEKDKGTLVYAFHLTTKGQSGYQLVTVDAMTGSLASNTHVAPKPTKKPQ
jgi:uncharacterized membrane protein YkoI